MKPELPDPTVTRTDTGADVTYRGVTPHAAAAGLPRIPLHNLRHSLATTMHGSAVPVAFAASWLGHSPTMMLTVYTKADQKKAAQATGQTISDVIGWTAG